jgi:glycosyltransferase involved in cell wall biosynthesis
LTTELIRDRGIICSVVLPSEGPLKDKLDEVAVSTSVVDYSWWCQPIRPSDKQISAQFSRSLKNVINHTRHELSKINPDIVCSNTMVIPWGAIAASSLDKPHVWFIHEFGILDHGFEFYLPFKRVLEIIRNSSNMIVTNSNAVREGLWGGTSAGNIVTVYPFTDIRHDATSQDIGVSFRRPGATKLVITGLITESKGQRDAVLAVKELIRRKRDVELIIMGPSIPSYLTELKRTVKDEALDEYVKFVDFKENPYPIVSQADIAVVCSRSEAFGLVTLEAMLLKKPVVGTNSGATPELIKEGFNGLLYESGHHDQLADKIEYLMQHNDKIEEFGENGYKLANASFTRAEYVGKVHEMLRDLRNKENPSTTPYSQFLTELFDDVQKRHCDIITRLTKGYQKVVDKVLPPGTRRRNLYVLGSSGIKVISSEGVVPFCVKTSRYIGRYVMSHDPRNPAGKA